MNSGKQNWENFGKNDPYYWVTNSNKYRKGNLTQDVRKDFFDSADIYIESIFSIIRSHLDSTFTPENALDFGCGVGRVAIPLARHCKYVLGIDVAESMVAEAKKNSNEFQLDNTDFSANTNLLSSGDKRFNFIHSIYVFQHIRTQKGLQIFSQLVDGLKENGVGMFHFITYQSIKSIKKRIIYWLSVHIPLFKGLNNIRTGKSFFTPMYEMNNYPLNKVFEILREQECSHMYARYTKEGPYNGVMLFFQKKRGDHGDFISLKDIP